MRDNLNLRYCHCSSYSVLVVASLLGVKVECYPVTVQVELELPFMNCTDTEYPYLSYETTTATVMADTMDCKVEKRAVCKPRTVTKCSSIRFTTCSEAPVEECREETVPRPSKEKIHRQWCLYGEGEHPNASSTSLTPSARADLPLHTSLEVGRNIEDWGFFGGFNLRNLKVFE